MPSSILISAAPQRPPSLHHLALQQNTKSAGEMAGGNEEAVLMGEKNQVSLGGVPEDVWRIILKSCWENGARDLYSASLVCKAFYRLADEVKPVKNCQIRDFLSSAEAESLFEEKSFKGLQKTFQIIHEVVADDQIQAFLFSKEAAALFAKKTLKELQGTFQSLCEAVKKGEVFQARLCKETLQKSLQGEFPRMVRELSLKQENPPLKQLTQNFLLKELRNGNFLAAMQILSTRSLSKYQEGDPDIGEAKLTQGDLVAMELCTQKELRDEAAVAALVGCYRGDTLAEQLKLYDEAVSAKQVTGELALFLLTYISSIFTQKQKPNIKHFIGLIPEWVWAGVVKTYKSYPLIAAKDLLASRIEAIVGTETLQWAISNRKQDLLIAFLESDSNPNEAGKNALRCAMELGRSEMVDVLLRWAIAKNRGALLKTLLALIVDQNVLKEALAYAKKMHRVNSSALPIVLERLESLDAVVNYPTQQISTLRLANSA